MIAFTLAVVGLFAPESVDVSLLHEKDVARLRLSVTVEGHSPFLDWAQFPDKLFDHFDRDGDGLLSSGEASRVFALPLPNGRTTNLNIPDKTTRSDFGRLCREAGFAPVVAEIRAPSAEQLRLSEALFVALDRDTDGKLTREELEKAPALLRRLDENEDEVISAAELLAFAAPAKNGTVESIVKAGGAGEPHAVMRLDLGKLIRSAQLESASKVFAGVAVNVFRVPGGRVVLSGTNANAGFRTAKSFYLAQFTEALGSKDSLAKMDLEADASLQAIAAMFDAADRNGDGKLTAAEMRAFLDLIELAVGCQVVVTVADCGNNLHDLLDTNGDGKLDLAELNRAARVCELVAELPLKRDAIPRQLRLSVSRSTLSTVFGPVPIPTAPAPKAKSVAPVAVGPRWFQAMDKNSDGFVSPAEFISSPELFRKLDVNGDGQISASEAEAFKP